VREKLLEFFASRPYYRCVLLVARDVARLERQADELAHDAGWPLVSVGRRLSLALRSTPPGQRPRTAQQSLQEVLSHAEPVPLVCTNIYLLFEPTLHLDPLALFREASRSIALVVALRQVSTTKQWHTLTKRTQVTLAFGYTTGWFCLPIPSFGKWLRSSDSWLVKGTASPHVWSNAG